MISYAGRKKKDLHREENRLNTKIELLEQDFDLDPYDEVTLNNIKISKNKLQEIREIKLKGALLRSRANILNFIEKPTKFFINLENNNFISKNIRELKLKDGRKINNPEEILSEMWEFYSKLYEKKVLKKSKIIIFVG